MLCEVILDSPDGELIVGARLGQLSSTNRTASKTANNRTDRKKEVGRIPDSSTDYRPSLSINEIQHTNKIGRPENGHHYLRRFFSTAVFPGKFSLPLCMHGCMSGVAIIMKFAGMVSVNRRETPSMLRGDNVIYPPMLYCKYTWDTLFARKTN